MMRSVRDVAMPISAAVRCGAASRRRLRDRSDREVRSAIAVGIATSRRRCRPGPASWFPGPTARHRVRPRPPDAVRARAEPSRRAHRRALRTLAQVAAGKAHRRRRPVPGCACEGRRRAVAATRRRRCCGRRHARGRAGADLQQRRLQAQELGDLDGATVAYAEAPGSKRSSPPRASRIREVAWKAVDVPSADALIAQVSDGTIDYAIVPSIDAAVARNIYLDFDVAFPAGPRRELAWAVAPGQTALRDDVDAFLAGCARDGTLARLAERYFGRAAQRVQRIDAGVFRERIRSRAAAVPALLRGRAGGDRHRVAAARGDRLPGIAMGPVRDQRDRRARPHADHRGHGAAPRRRRSPRSERVERVGAARYLRDLKAKLPARIAEPDRTWLALAAFNIGLGHLEDARILAQKQKLNPDLWSDVRKALPLLALPEYYENAKLRLRARRHAGRVRRPRARATTTSCCGSERRSSRGCSAPRDAPAPPRR